MKKEMFAGALIIIMLSISVFNMFHVKKMTNELIDMINEAEQAAEDGDWDKSEEYAENATDIWKGHDSYTHIVLVHEDTDAIYDALYELMEKIYSRDAGAVKGVAKNVSNDLESMYEMERLRIGSIF